MTGDPGFANAIRTYGVLVLVVVVPAAEVGR
jgi:hypothetical protein